MSLLIDLKPIAFFCQAGHSCFIYDKAPPILFILNKKCNKLTYSEEKIDDDLIISDDSHSSWVYSFIDKKFNLIKSFSWCK
jgi:hypothetical protein